MRLIKFMVMSLLFWNVNFATGVESVDSVISRIKQKQAFLKQGLLKALWPYLEGYPFDYGVEEQDSDGESNFVEAATSDDEKDASGATMDS